MFSVFLSEHYVRLKARCFVVYELVDFAFAKNSSADSLANGNSDCDPDCEPDRAPHGDADSPDATLRKPDLPGTGSRYRWE